jgi:benzylsuccinate CoA-transferase BbsF subunit
VNINNSLFFGRENASKYSMALNLKHPDGLKLAERLIKKSDVVLDSYTSGVMDKYGLGYKNLKKLKSDIVMISSCMFGQTGELRSMPGYGVPLTAMSGITYLCGWPDRKPTGPYGSYTDYLVPRLNLLAIVSALDYRRRTGKGLYIDAAQIEASVQFVAPALLEYDANKRVRSRAGNSSPIAAPHGVYRCRGKEKWCAIAVYSCEEWQSFCDAIGNPSWTKEEKFSTIDSRKENEEEMNASIEKWTSEKEADEVMTVLQEHGVPAGLLNKGDDLENDPQFKHCNYYTKLKHPEMGMVHYTGHSIQFSKATQEVWRSPCLGEHTEYVCKEMIGLTHEEYVRYSEEGIFK